MSSLSAHLRQPDDHARLAFHPECPVCRSERLAGRLPREELVSRRTQAALTAGLLALSYAAVPAMAVADPDQTSEGTAAPAPSGGDPATSPDFDPGGGSTELPAEAAPAPQAPGPPVSDDDDGSPVEAEPITDVTEPVVDLGDGEDPSGGQPPPTPEAGSPGAAAEPPASPDQPVATPTPQAPDPTADDETSGAGHPGADTHGERRTRRPGRATPDSDVRQRHTVEVVTAPRAAPSPPTAEPQVATAVTASAPVAVARPRGGRAAPGDRFHVVLEGESLWSIAADRLGGRATIPRVAREVDRLWQLNREQIATGNPDLLRIGTRLRLR
jgi:hypothetical protein